MKKIIDIHSKLSQTLILFMVFALLYGFVEPTPENILWRLPPLLADLPGKIDDWVKFAMFKWLPIQIYDPEINDYETSALLKEVTRSISGFILFIINFIREILLGGVKTIVAFTGWDFVRAHPLVIWPALPWTVLTINASLLGYALNGRNLAALVKIALVYIASFGQWEPAMETLSFVLVAAPVSIIIGLLVGVLAYKYTVIDKILKPALNVAQTMPHFSYLVPVMVFFGVGDHAGAIATIIFATPPMVRLTILGLRNVASEVLEAGKMSGCTNRQLLFRVQIPSARRDILFGVNQVIMQCLAMAVIASFIGAKGLGFNLLLALNQLRIGQALELGICIVLIAVVLDKLSLAWANKKIDYFADLNFMQRNKFAVMMLSVLAVGIIMTFSVSIIFPNHTNYLYLVPHNGGLTTENFWQAGVDWIVDNWYQPLQIFNNWFIIDVLIPTKKAFLGMPVVATFTLVMGIGYLVGGFRTALIAGSFLMFIALTEWWDRALITCYLTAFSVIFAGSIGFAVGSLAAPHDRGSKIILLICDTLQTFPSFIYLIPVIMLFGITDTSVIFAVVVYASIPATRYTIEGLRGVPPSLIDSGLMSGTTRWQRWVNIELPLAFPHIMLGINQTVIFALFMVIIGAMIGTDDLGQYILKALSDKKGIGNGLMLGFCVAFIGLTVDLIIQTWAQKKRKELGFT